MRHWHVLKERYESLATRERLLILGAVLAGFYLLWDFILLQPIAKQEQQLLARKEAAQKAISISEAEISVLGAVANRDPTIPIKKEIVVLETELQKLDEELAEISHGLIPSDQLAFMLHEVLKINRDLKVVNVKTQPSTEIVLGQKVERDSKAPSAEGSNSDRASIKLYRHGVDMTFQGNYVDVLNYMQQLEIVDWKFYWDQLTYQVKNYPKAEVSLRVFTLSTEKSVFEGI